MKFDKNILKKFKCPNCGFDELRFGKLSQDQSGLPDGTLLCPHCDRSYEIEDGIINLVSNLTPEMSLEDAAHKRSSDEDNRDDAWLLGLPDSHIEKQGNERNRQYVRSNWSLFCQMKDALSLSLGDEVLEIGAGVTWATRYIAKEGYDCTALDLTTHMYRGLRSARVYFEHDGIYYNLIRGIMEKLPFKDGTYDKIFSIAALHHSSDLRKTFSEINRVLRPGGRAVIVDSTAGWWVKIAYRKHIEEMREQWGLNDHQFSLTEWLSAARVAGFYRNEVLFPNYLMRKLSSVAGHDLSKLKPFLNLLLPPYHELRGTGLVLILKK